VISSHDLIKGLAGEYETAALRWFSSKAGMAFSSLAVLVVLGYILWRGSL
jgi:hypothetical protein